MSIPVPSIRRREGVDASGWDDSVPEVLQRVYASRGIVSAQDGELRLARLLAPDLMGGMQKAAELLARAIRDQVRIVVVGDFDCDGATGTAVAVRGLRLLGAENVAYRVPHRVEHGYGLSPALVADMASMAPDLVLTVDSGIACVAGVAAARARGWQVVVSDHHLPGPVLPDADAIVDPNLDGDAFPSKALAGVGVVFYLLLAIRRVLREGGAPAAATADLSRLLDLVAVGTVADLVPLDYNNRVLVAAGLQRIRRGECQPGVTALAAVAGRALSTLCASDIGFAIAPRLNAAGRLEDMAVGIECLLTDDPVEAGRLAAALDAINAERRELQQQMVDQAEALLEALPIPEGGLPPIVCLHDPGWHPGVVGLVASKVKERLHRPVLAFAPAEPGSDRLRGSARSIAGFHVRDALAEVDATCPGLIERFGGHAMAAGLSLSAGNLEALVEALEAVAARRLDPASLAREILSDGPLEGRDFSRALAEQLRLAGPWGQAFPEPVFDNEFELLDWRTVGERHLKLRVLVEGRREPLSAIHFGGCTGQPPPQRLRMAYQLDLDDFRGRRDIQLLVRHIEPA